MGAENFYFEYHASKIAFEYLICREYLDVITLQAEKINESFTLVSILRKEDYHLCTFSQW